MPRPSPPLLVLIIPTIAFFLWLIANPSFLSTTTHHRVVRPSNSIHKSWDSLNIFLVLFAILCGVFARKYDDDSSDNTNTSNSSSGLNYKEGEDDDEKRSVSNLPSWFDQFSNERPTFPSRRLKRSSSSYPNLRQESWENPVDEDQRFRFFDDFELSHRLYTSSPSSEYIHHRRNRTTLLSEESNDKEIPVDTFVLRSPPSPSPPPPPPPPPPKKVYKTIPRNEKSQKQVEKIPPPPPPPPPPRPPPSPLPERKYVNNGRKKTNATKEIKIILASLYNQRKRKMNQRNMKKKKKNINTYDHVSAQPTSEHTSYFRQPPPPPPPPPPSKFYNLFHKRNHRSKKIHSFSAPPPPPPPPPRKPQAPPSTPPRKNSIATGKPPLPTRVINYYEENVNSGNQSPSMPPPPPPPPFKVQGFRFVVSGDFVRIRSASSSRCGSPDREEVKAARGGNGGGASVFCPSPDVNVKADSFIARLRDEWRLEKMNSCKEKSVGPTPSP